MPAAKKAGTAQVLSRTGTPQSPEAAPRASAPKERKLTPRQERFIDEYLIDLNGTQAAKRAGFSEKTANEQAVRLLANVSIRSQIDQRIADRAKRTGITQDRVLQELARLAFADLRKAYNEDGTLKLPHEMDDDTAAALAGLETTSTAIGDVEDPATLATKKLKTWDKKGALELCMRHLGMFNDKLELTIPTVRVKDFTGKK